MKTTYFIRAIIGGSIIGSKRCKSKHEAEKECKRANEMRERRGRGPSFIIQVVKLPTTDEKTKSSPIVGAI